MPKALFQKTIPFPSAPGANRVLHAVDHFLTRADLIIGIGTSFTRSLYITPVPEGKTIIQVTIDESDLSKDYPITLGIVGDAAAVLRQILQQLGSPTGSQLQYS